MSAGQGGADLTAVGKALAILAAFSRHRPALRLSDLAAATDLAVREGHELVFVERFAGRTAVPVLTTVGGRFALSPTGVGLVLLAYAPAGVQEQVLATPPRPHTPLTLTDPRELRRVLAEVRHTGMAISDRQVTMDAVSAAAPVRGPDGSVVAALSVVVRGDGPAAVKAHMPAVRTAARGISRALTAPA